MGCFVGWPKQASLAWPGCAKVPKVLKAPKSLDAPLEMNETIASMHLADARRYSGALPYLISELLVTHCLILRFCTWRSMFLFVYLSCTIWYTHAVAGPFKINGVPLRRVNQAYVIGTSTKVDISGVNVEKFDDKYFAMEVQKKKKKGEGEFFETEKQEAKTLPQEKKDDQKAVDAPLLKAIEGVPDLRAYLDARFSLRAGMKPHELVF
ncbi:hypothetical protein Taro_026908 [Colocasia esculenta]|uniref:60S ribosomal protein L6 n=1 Tax=Colocasia esculenta TaxID=4460 RepID=A0A843VQ15_COLES|nr:hypothetical protein [Colocasia esculenta]